MKEQDPCAAGNAKAGTSKKPLSPDAGIRTFDAEAPTDDADAQTGPSEQKPKRAKGGVVPVATLAGTAEGRKQRERKKRRIR